MNYNELLKIINETRESNSLYTIDELINIVGKNNIIYDPISTLISKNITIGKNNTFYPNTSFISLENSNIIIGDHNVFYNGTCCEAAKNAEIKIGNNNYFNIGPICIKCNINNGSIIINNHGRFDGRINIFGNCIFGDGSQILGTINVYNCILESGNDYTYPNPDSRAGLIKGIGTAKDLCIKKGMVINGFGNFHKSLIEPQSNYHKN